MFHWFGKLQNECCTTSYPWISPPPELYGWDATNYNGGSLRFSTSLGDTNVAASVFGGRESIDKSPYNKLYLAGNTQVTWDNIVGSDLELSNGPLTVRAVYMRSNIRTVNADAALDDSAGLKAYGIAANLDFDDWFVLSEITKLTRDNSTQGYSYAAPTFTVGAGVRLGKWTPFVNVAQYTEESSDLSLYTPQSYKRTSATLRYDLDSRSTVKAQIDKHTDTTNNFGGNTTVFRLSFDRVF